MSCTVLPSASRAGRDAHVFTVFSTKGGSGKTVIATNLAVCFARQGLRTLLVDLDLHSGDDAWSSASRRAGRCSTSSSLPETSMPRSWRGS